MIAETFAYDSSLSIPQRKRVVNFFGSTESGPSKSTEATSLLRRTGYFAVMMDRCVRYLPKADDRLTSCPVANFMHALRLFCD